MSEELESEGLLRGLGQWVLMFGGLVLIGIGIVNSSVVLCVAGVVALAAGRGLYMIAQAKLHRQLEDWATEAVQGIGPVPPRNDRATLMRTTLQVRGRKGDVKATYQYACQEWARMQDPAPK